MMSFNAPSPYRKVLCREDEAAVHRLVRASGFFSSAECAIAAELVRESLNKGAEASGYHFLLLDAEVTGKGRRAREEQEVHGRLAAFACFGSIACTQASFDLYWIVVEPELRGGGLGTRLLAAAEKAIRTMGGQRVYAETSGRDQYAPTRAFYGHMGYVVDAVQEHFYAPGEAKVTYVKVLGSEGD